MSFGTRRSAQASGPTLISSSTRRAPPVADQWLGDQLGDPPARVQRTERILVDHLQRPPGPHQVPPPQPHQVDVLELDLARLRARRLDQRPGRRGLAGTGLADHPDVVEGLQEGTDPTADDGVVVVDELPRSPTGRIEIARAREPAGAVPSAG